MIIICEPKIDWMKFTGSQQLLVSTIGYAWWIIVWPLQEPYTLHKLYLPNLLIDICPNTCQYISFLNSHTTIFYQYNFFKHVSQSERKGNLYISSPMIATKCLFAINLPILLHVITPVRHHFATSIRGVHQKGLDTL